MLDYSKKGHYYIEEPRFELRRLAPFLPKSASVLDMGAGNGNNTKFLLHKGFRVTAVEPNPEAIKTLKLLQKSYPKNLKVIEASLNDYEPKEAFDVVICCMVIHFIEGHDAGIKSVSRIQSWTKPGGLNLVTGYMGHQPLSSDYSFLFEPDELGSLYKDWGIRWQQESFRLTFSRIYSPKDIPRLLLGKRGFMAARIIAKKD